LFVRAFLILVKNQRARAVFYVFSEKIMFP